MLPNLQRLQIKSTTVESKTLSVGERVFYNDHWFAHPSVNEKKNFDTQVKEAAHAVFLRYDVMKLLVGNVLKAKIEMDSKGYVDRSGRFIAEQFDLLDVPTDLGLASGLCLETQSVLQRTYLQFRIGINSYQQYNIQVAGVLQSCDSNAGRSDPLVFERLIDWRAVGALAAASNSPANALTKESALSGVTWNIDTLSHGGLVIRNMLLTYGYLNYDNVYEVSVEEVLRLYNQMNKDFADGKEVKRVPLMQVMKSIPIPPLMMTSAGETFLDAMHTIVHTIVELGVHIMSILALNPKGSLHAQDRMDFDSVFLTENSG